MSDTPPEEKKPTPPPERGLYDHIDFGFYRGDPSGAKTEIEAVHARHFALGLSQDHLVRLFAGGSDASFDREFSGRQDYQRERERIKAILRGNEAEVGNYTAREALPEYTGPAKSLQQSFREIFKMTTDEAFKGEWPFDVDFNQAQRHDLARWSVAAVAREKGTPNACLLLGPTQRGKTYSIRWTTAQLLNSGANVRYARTSDLCARHQYWQLQKTDLDRRSAHQIVEEMKDADMLFIDELGAEQENYSSRLSPWLYEVLEARNQHRRPTCIASNLTERSIDERYDERVTGRIRNGGVKIIQYGASCPDYATWEKAKGNR